MAGECTFCPRSHQARQADKIANRSHRMRETCQRGDRGSIRRRAKKRSPQCFPIFNRGWGRGRMPRMLFMVIERFKDNDMVPIYKRVRDEGRMIPEGLRYLDSWIEPNFSRCFQLMECDDLRLFQEWCL